jgi:glycosyltransferase involved in cell wall biosynthesis
MTRPTICAVIIARNEERDLPRCLASVKSFAEKIVLLDTGSTDNTRRIAAAHGVSVGLYFGASEHDPDRLGELRITDFSKARNYAIERAEETGCTHIFWLDADDVVETPLAVRRAAYLPPGALGMWVELGASGRRHTHIRMWPASAKLRFKGRCHEYVDIGELPYAVLDDVCIRHDGTPHESAGESSGDRNLRLLTAEWKEAPNARTAFYLGNTHMDAGRYQYAIEWYLKRLGFDDKSAEERLFTRLYLARSLRLADEPAAAAAQCEEALALAPGWHEFTMELAFMAYQRKDFEAAEALARRALGAPVPRSQMWREPQMYGSEPARLLSFLEYERAKLAAVDEPPPAIIAQAKERIALHRPGAIGDILMTLNLLPAFRAAHPDAEITYFCDAHLAQPDELGWIILAAGADLVMDAAQLAFWRRSFDSVIDLVGYPLAEGYPEKPMRGHLLQYFGAEMGLAVAQDYEDPLPTLVLPRPPRADWTPEPYLTLQTTAGWSAYKEWPAHRWAEFLARMPARRIVFIGADQRRSLKRSIALFANARMHVGIDSFCNHLTQFTWHDNILHWGKVPGVILWGSTQASAAGYAHNTNISLGLPCQPCFREDPKISKMPRDPCQVGSRVYGDGLHKCMADIQVDRVVEAVREIWERTT